MPLRILKPADLPSALAIEEATQVTPWTLDTFEQCLQAGYVGWVIEQENNLIGFIVISFIAGECHILNLCVDPAYQHQGFGWQLLTHALAEVEKEGGGTAYLEVRSSNKNAIALYKKMGFKQVGERKGYYPIPNGREDALMFAKHLGVQ